MPSYAQNPAGVTELSKKFVEKHLREIGRLRHVMCCGFPEVVEYLTCITGDEGRIVVDGFAWGYGGTGPHGLLWLLKDKLGISISIQEIAGLDSKEPHLWKL